MTKSKSKGNMLVPYTLWGEIAYQIGRERLYREVEKEVTSYAAPGKMYFERVLKYQKVIIMLDELAQIPHGLKRPGLMVQVSLHLF